MNAPRLDVVLFDVDDTLYSTTEFALIARRNAVKAMIAHGLEGDVLEVLGELDEVVAEFTSNYEHHFDRLLDRLGHARLGGHNPAVVVAAGIIAYHRTKEEDMRILPDARDLLEALRDARVRTGIVSAGLQVKQAEKIVRLGILPLIDPRAIFFSDQLGVSKPNPKIYLKVCAALNLPPARALYVGDRASHDVAPARKAGLRTVHYVGSHGRWVEQRCEEPADHVVRDLRELLPILRDTYGLPLPVEAA